MRTNEECKKILFKLGIECGVSPRLISTHLLSDYDKALIREGFIDISSLKRFVEVWRDNGMPNQVLGREELSP